jgi:hypothetical protein
MQERDHAVKPRASEHGIDGSIGIPRPGLRLVPKRAGQKGIDDVCGRKRRDHAGFSPTVKGRADSVISR